MRGLRWIAALWPGLLGAWALGSPRALLLAMAFGAALNLALVTTFVWPSVMYVPRPLAGPAAWVLVLGLLVWGIALLRAQWRELFPPRQSDPQVEDWFRQAQNAYLRGHWLEAESLVQNILQRRPADVEARLLRASIERRTRRFVEARKSINELLTDETVSGWRMEMQRELEQIADAEQESHASIRVKAA
jgi:hypothetical protein